MSNWLFYYLFYGTKINLSEIENLVFVDNLIFLWKDESQKTSHPGINLHDFVSIKDKFHYDCSYKMLYSN